MADLKAREDKLRRLAHDQGLHLMKSRCRTPRMPEYGTYMLIDPYVNQLAVWGLPNGFGLSIDEVAAALA